MSSGAASRGAAAALSSSSVMMARCLALRCSSGAMASSSSSRYALPSAFPSSVFEPRIGTSLFSAVARLDFSSNCFSARAVLPTAMASSSTSSSSTLFLFRRPRLQQPQRQQQHSDAAPAAAATAATADSPSSPSSPSKSRADPEGLRLTGAAVERVRWLLAKREAKKKEEEEEEEEGAAASAIEATPTVLRLTVEAGGCSGFSYVFALDDGGARKGDRAFGELGEVKGGGTSTTAATAFASNDPRRALVVVDPVSFDLVKGSTVDFEQELIKAGFEVVDNPNAEAGCGCGSSFAAKIF